VRRQERQGIEITLVLRRQPHAQVDVRLIDLAVAARPDRPDRRAFRHRRVPGHADRAEMSERDGVSVERLDRDALSRRRNRAGEGDGSRSRCEHRRTFRAFDVDAPMLPGGIRMGGIELKGAEHRTAGRPCPCARPRRKNERGHDRWKKNSTHRHHLCDTTSAGLVV
jgi:hypothetical protein